MQALATIARRCSLSTRRRFQHLRVMPYLAAELDLELQVPSAAQSGQAAQLSRPDIVGTSSYGELNMMSGSVKDGLPHRQQSLRHSSSPADALRRGARSIARGPWHPP